MRKAGLKIVRLGEFAWSRIQPDAHTWDFVWLDEIIERLHGAGIRVLLGTPTACPPKWLIDLHPDICKLDEHGHVQGFGSRRHYCYNNPHIKAYASAVVEKMSQRYGHHPALAAWQIDNEFTCGDGLYCYCENCRMQFIQWLQKRYDTIEQLNEAWGTAFWGQTYAQWDQIIVPRKAQATLHNCNGHNPGLMLDYSRFCSDSVVSFAKMECDIIRERSDAPIGHNMVSERYDYYEMGKTLDFAMHDSYPANAWGSTIPVLSTEIYDPAFTVDIVRGAKRHNIWMAEQQCGPMGWNVTGRLLRPGQIRAWTMQAMAHGAESVLFFRWRSARYGIEQYVHGILDYDGIPRRRYDEVKEIAELFCRFEPYNTNSAVCSDVLIVRSFDQQWMHTQQQHSWGFGYREYIRTWYRSLYKRNIQADISSAETDFAAYRLVILPAFGLVTPGLRLKLEQYVAGGGTLVITFRSGIKDMNSAMIEEVIPGCLRDVTGITVAEYDSIHNDRVGVQGEGLQSTASVWADLIQPVTAECVAAYTDHWYAGTPAVTRNLYGKGACYYVGCDLDDEGMDALLAGIIERADVTPSVKGPQEGVEAVAKHAADGRRFIVLINHSDTEQTISLPYRGDDILYGTGTTNTARLVPLGTAVYAEV